MNIGRFKLLFTILNVLFSFIIDICESINELSFIFIVSELLFPIVIKDILLLLKSDCIIVLSYVGKQKYLYSSPLLKSYNIPLENSSNITSFISSVSYKDCLLISEVLFNIFISSLFFNTHLLSIASILTIFFLSLSVSQ